MKRKTSSQSDLENQIFLTKLVTRNILDNILSNLQEKILVIEKRLDLLLVILLVRISSCVMN